MALLSDGDFYSHQALLGSGYSALTVVQGVLESGFAMVVASTDAQVAEDMLIAFSINLETVNVNATANLLRGATEALLRHITSGSGQTINDYLYTNDIKVGQDFADLSETLGVPIVSANIE